MDTADTANSVSRCVYNSTKAHLDIDLPIRQSRKITITMNCFRKIFQEIQKLSQYNHTSYWHGYVNRLEMVLRRYVRYASNDCGRTSRVTDMLKIIFCDPLEDNYVCIIIMCRIVHNLVEIPVSDCLIRGPYTRILAQGS